MLNWYCNLKNVIVGAEAYDEVLAVLVVGTGVGDEVLATKSATDLASGQNITGGIRRRNEEHQEAVGWDYPSLRKGTQISPLFIDHARWQAMWFTRGRRRVQKIGNTRRDARARIRSTSDTAWFWQVRSPYLRGSQALEAFFSSYYDKLYDAWTTLPPTSWDFE